MYSVVLADLLVKIAKRVLEAMQQQEAGMMLQKPKLKHSVATKMTMKKILTKINNQLALISTRGDRIKKQGSPRSMITVTMLIPLLKEFL